MMMSVLPIYRFDFNEKSVRYIINDTVPVIIIRTINRLVNCNKNNNHNGILGGGVNTLWPYSLRFLIAWLAVRPQLLLGFRLSIWHWYNVDSLLKSHRCSEYAPAGPLPPSFSIASLILIIGSIIFDFIGNCIIDNDDADPLLIACITDSLILIFLLIGIILPSLSDISLDDDSRRFIPIPSIWLVLPWRLTRIVDDIDLISASDNARRRSLVVDNVVDDAGGGDDGGGDNDDDGGGGDNDDDGGGGDNDDDGGVVVDGIISLYSIINYLFTIYYYYYNC